MHANLHTEFIHSVSFLMSEDLNAHLFCGVTRNQLWHSRIAGKLDRAEIEKLKCLIGSGLNCNYKSWVGKLHAGAEESNYSFKNNLPGQHLDMFETISGHNVTSHSKPCLFVSNVCCVNSFLF
jgi:hypothetical protein